MSGQANAGPPVVHPHAHPHAAHPQHLQHAHMVPTAMTGAGYPMAPMHPQAVASMQHTQGMHGASPGTGHMHSEPTIPAPYMPMHQMPGHAGGVDMSMQMAPPSVGQVPQQASDDVPAPSDAVGLYDMHDTHLTSPNTSVPMPPIGTQETAGTMQPPQATEAGDEGAPPSAGPGSVAPAASAAAVQNNVINHMLGAVQECSSKDEVLAVLKALAGNEMSGAGGAERAIHDEGAPSHGNVSEGIGMDGGVHPSDPRIPSAEDALADVAEAT